MQLVSEEEVNEYINLSIWSSPKIDSSIGKVSKDENHLIFKYFIMDRDTVLDLKNNYVFKVKVLPSFFDRYGETLNFLTSSKVLNYTAKNLLYEILKQEGQGIKRKLILEAKILLLIQNLLDTSQSLSSKTREMAMPISETQVQKAIQFIQVNLDKKLSVSNIANEIGTNQMYLKRSFKAYTGITIYQFIQKYRMDLAIQLIKHKKHTLSEVATKIGFSSLSSFSQAFRNYHGVNPSQFLVES
ncbi:helix-turn-helix domain-containing protein [Membranihabitans marinus]|uniref:helix-turn-helix domain-containing protein n=1 Tax=Membranihabitans marinus TaxID=1227546 RepID=UPI001F43A8A8|nr:AraC family transcriptional regulator [Membranihabitans marinus]